MNSEKKDIHFYKRDFRTALSKLENSTELNKTNKELILKFIRDCRLGKTLRNRQKKVIGEARCLKYIHILKKISNWIDKPFDEADQEDIEKVVENLVNDKYVYEQKNKSGKVIISKKLSHSTKVDYKKTLRKFYKWLLGDNKYYPELVDWIETYDVVKEIPALRREDVEKLAAASNIRDKTIIMFLFDSGARAEEFLNIRVGDLSIEEDVYKVRIQHSKTKPRTIHLPIASKYVELWLNEINRKDNMDFLFPISYEAMRMMLHRVGKRVLNKCANPHLFRHSSATYYANLLNHQQLCYRYGWAMSSDMPNRYLDREGIFEKESVAAVKMNDMSKMESVNQKLKEELIVLKQTNNHLSKEISIVNNKFEDLMNGQNLMELIFSIARRQDAMIDKIKSFSGESFDVVLP